MFNMVTFKASEEERTKGDDDDDESELMSGNNGNGKLNRMNMHEIFIHSCELCNVEVSELHSEVMRCE